MRGHWAAVVGLLVACTRPDGLSIDLPPGTFTVAYDIGVIPRGETFYYAAYAVNDGRWDGTVPALWRSVDVSVATVDDDGAVTAQNVGTTDVIASFWGLEAALRVTVTCAVPVRVSAYPGDRLDLHVGETTRLVISTYDARGRDTCQPVTFHVDDSSVVTVAADGLVTAVAPGEADVDVYVPRVVNDLSVHVTVD